VLFRTLRAGEKTTMGGWLPKALKKLNGARLGWPFLSTVLANAIGRGAMEAPYTVKNRGFYSLGSIFMYLIAILALLNSIE